MNRNAIIFVVLFLLIAVWGGTALAASGPIHDGPELDYQPSIIRELSGSRLLMIFERLDTGDFFGDLMVTWSDDNGETWDPPSPAVATIFNERHPALVQLAANQYVLFYLLDETSSNSFRIYRATSTNGSYWTEQGAVDLGWDTPGEINPSVISEGGGVLTMTYHRLSGPAYIARSTDSGVTWDQLKTQVSDGQGALPRLAKRESDGRYLVTWQVGGSDLDLFGRYSHDPYDWSGEAIPLSTEINTHDSQPIVLEDGTFLVAYARQVGSVFDLYYQTSANCLIWSEPVRVTSDTQHYDTQPHPLLQGTPGRLILAWSHQQSSSAYVDHDVWVDNDLQIELPPQFQPLIVAGPGPGPTNPTLVRLFLPDNPGIVLREWEAYGVSMYGVNVARGNVASTASDEILTGAGPGEVFGPHVRSFCVSGAPTPGVSFLAYGTNKYGVNVAAGDLDGDGWDEIVTGAGPGAVFGPHVRGWNVDDGTAAAIPGISYFAYGTLKWGVNVACGDIDGDGFDEIVTGAGPGAVFGPHVRGWNVDGGAAAAIPGVSFFAYGTLKYGVNIAAGDVDGDGIDEILTGPGPGVVFSAHLRGWNYDGTTLSELSGINMLAYPADWRYGARVTAADLDEDGDHDILTIPGPSPDRPANIRGWRVESGAVIEAITGLDFDAYQDLGLLYGGSVAAGLF